MKQHDAPTDLSQAIAAALAKEITPDRLAVAISDCLNATTVSRSGVVELDFRTRLQAVTLAMSYLVGKPKERETPVPVPPEAVSDQDTVTRLRHSPALRSLFRSLLAEAEATPDING